MPRARQWLTITCPQGHRLGRVRVNFGSRGGSRPDRGASMTAHASAGSDDGLRFDPERGKLIGSCRFCPPRDNAWTIPAKHPAGVLAAMLAYGPPSLTARITELRATVPGLIPEGDALAVDRRRWFGQMIANLGDTHRT